MNVRKRWVCLRLEGAGVGNKKGPLHRQGKKAMFDVSRGCPCIRKGIVKRKAHLRAKKKKKRREKKKSPCGFIVNPSQEQKNGHEAPQWEGKDEKGADRESKLATPKSGERK